MSPARLATIIPHTSIRMVIGASLRGTGLLQSTGTTPIRVRASASQLALSCIDIVSAEGEAVERARASRHQTVVQATENTQGNSDGSTGTACVKGETGPEAEAAVSGSGYGKSSCDVIAQVAPHASKEYEKQIRELFVTGFELTEFLQLDELSNELDEADLQIMDQILQEGRPAKKARNRADWNVLDSSIDNWSADSQSDAMVGQDSITMPSVVQTADEFGGIVVPLPNVQEVMLTTS